MEARLHHLDGDVGLGHERIEIVEIGDPGQPGHRHLDERAGSLIGPVGAVEGLGVLLGQQAGGGEIGHDAKARQSGALANHVERRVEEPDVAAELVDDVALEAAPLGDVEQRMGADQGGDDTAALDVADQDHRHVGGLGEAHVGDVGGPQVDLGGASRAFYQHQIGVAADHGEALQDAGQEKRLEGMVVAGQGGGLDASPHHHLGADVGLRLEEHRVHVDAGLDAAGARLQGLGAADLPAIRRHRGVVRHVLRLEGPDLQAAPRIGPAQAGHQQGLADIRPGALDHQGRGRRGVRTWQGPHSGARPWR